MPTNYNHDVVYISIPLSGNLAQLYADAGGLVSLPVPAELFRAALGQTVDPRERFSDTDVLIAAVLDKHGPLTAGEIRERLELDHDHLISDDSSIRRRFGRGMPLRDAGYRSTPRGYAAP